jgi:protein tyrosine/serine phosphatase
MRTRALHFALALALASPLAITAAAADEPFRASSAPFKRFIQVDHQLYRGSQPDEDGFRFLRDMGVRTIVSFRNDGSERVLVESLGMRFVQIPITFRAFGWGDDFDVTDVHRFFEVVDDPTAGPIFFHCKRGADRTGSIAAIYRIARQGWDADRAYSEARDIGMRWWYFPVKGQIRKYAADVQALDAQQ